MGFGNWRGWSGGGALLVHATAGGEAATQLAGLVGAEAFATVSTVEKREVWIREYGLRPDHIFSSRDTSFVKGIVQMMKGRGVDVVLNSLSGEALRRSWDILAPFGRFIEVGKKDSQDNGWIELNPFLWQVVMGSVNLTIIMTHKPKKSGQLIAESVRLYAEGKIKLPTPTKDLDYTQIEEAFRSLQSGKSMGKNVFKSNATGIVPMVPKALPPLQFNSEASYALAGGLGGIGRSIARWMVSRGARNLIFLSRSGTANDAAKLAVKDLEEMGCRVHVFACGVTNKSMLASVIEKCRAIIPPIEGCFKGSMVLRDAMFENMTYDDFKAALNPKAQGSWNLHEVLPTDMDFFVLLSSAARILGYRSQANYASGNTYQDALAKHRVPTGLSATSIDLGSILSVGYVAENKEKLKTIPTISSVPESLREDEIHSIIEYHLDTRRPNMHTSYHTVSGLNERRAVPPARHACAYIPHVPPHMQNESSATTASTEEDSLLSAQSRLTAATIMDEAVAVVSDSIRSKLSRLPSIAVDDIDPGKSVSSNGVDSLVAAEFRTWMAKELRANVPMLDIMGTSRILSFSAKVAGLSKLVQAAGAAQGDGKVEIGGVVDQIVMLDSIYFDS